MTRVEERRVWPDAEVRLAGGAEPVLTGYAVVYGAESRDLGGFVERVAPGAFRESLASGRDVVAFVNHNTSDVLGRVAAGTLRVWDDERGVGFELRLPNTQAGRDLAELVRRGDVRGSSFGFVCEDDDWQTRDGTTVREVRRATLVEVSPTAIPAYEDTSVALRSMPRGCGVATPRRDAVKRELLAMEQA